MRLNMIKAGAAGGAGYTGYTAAYPDFGGPELRKLENTDLLIFSLAIAYSDLD